MKRIQLFLFALMFNLVTVFSQNDPNILIGLNAPALGVTIQTSWPGTSGWSRGFHIANNDNSKRFIGFGGFGSNINGRTSLQYGWIGEAWNRTFMVFRPNGNIGIGTRNPDAKLAVNGNIHTKEVKVDLNGWADFVFDKNYNLPSLEEVENHIISKGHLQDIPSAEEIEKDGVRLGEMNKKLLQKIEELTLYTIKQEKSLKEQQKDIEELKRMLKEQSEIINQLKK